MQKIFLSATISGLLMVAATASALTPNEQLGKNIFFDKNLSINQNMSCASCHAPETGFTGPDSAINAHGTVYEGSIAGRFGNRKPPTSAYATTSPVLYFTPKKAGTFIGGNFWDGRATGEKLGNPAADQAQGPFLNPLEHALATPFDVVSKICTGPYSFDFTDLFQQSYPNIDPCVDANANMAYDFVALSIAAYEGSQEVNSFSSKYDFYLAGKTNLTKQEKTGQTIFSGKGKCDRCHTITPMRAIKLFTDYTYDNLGIPRNQENPFYTMLEFNPLGSAWIDLGLGDFLVKRLDYARYANMNYGKHKVPTLRNVDKRPDPQFVKAFGHNGYFKSLEEIVHFYNTRDVLPVCQPGDPGEKTTCWPPPELSNNMNTKDLGNLGLTHGEEAALVSFLKTLSDGYVLP